MSGEFIIKDQPMDGTDQFALPPAAISPATASRRSSRSNDPTYAPVSPTSPDLTGRGSVSSRSGNAAKRPLEDFDLPPPPTRTRKIIQMKPKSPAPSKAPARPKEGTKANNQTSPESTSNAPSKKKNPSATSAAGRKIARKTAHSLIERRRRSKMNEEFGTLKDMIPACRGQEMHKLAILQASIDYVNYLERCISDLKTAGGNPLAGPPSPSSPEFFSEPGGDAAQQPSQRPPSSLYSYSASESPDTMHPSAHVSDTSPSFSPRTRMPSVHTLPDIASVLPSPALGPVNPPMEKLQELQGGTADSINENFGSSTTLASKPEENRAADAQRRKGMSVRDSSHLMMHEYTNGLV
ncbi:hypothetical protein N7470_009614 [Penicillium chermesinum]|nr:hypothetical protein N7470_009614 [Penicillium chermesinum]